MCRERERGVFVSVCVSESEREKSTAVIYAAPPALQLLAAHVSAEVC